MTEDRIRREKAFHDDRWCVRGSAPRRGAGKYYSITGSASAHLRTLVTRYCNGRRLLEYGCGTGGSSSVWARSGAIVTGIDISPRGIERARERAETEGFDARYLVMNAERTEFEDDSFDVVVGSGILHHLDLDRSYAELGRILDAGGHAVFLEPLGHNPLINLYRRFTRSMRTEDEHPLTRRNIESAARYFAGVEARYFYLLSLLAVPFRRAFFFGSFLKLLESLDGLLMRCFPRIKKYAWIIVLHLHHPRTSPPTGG